MYMNILYILIFFVACLFIYSTWTRKKIYKEVDRLEDWKTEIMNKPITEEISKVKGLKMSGETEQRFEIWRSSWDTIVTEKLPNLEEDLFDVEELANKYRFKKAKQLNSEIETELKNIEFELKTLLADVDMLVNSEEKNREEISDIRINYYDVRKFFSVHRGSFGKCATILEERLEKVYKQFPEFEKATEDGNYLEASQILERIKIETSEIQDNMKEIPKFLVQLQSQIPSDLNNLQQGLKEMEEDGYAIEHFSIEKDIKEIEEQCEQTLAKLDILELSTVEVRLKEITVQIDEMYDALEVEVKSRGMVLEALRGIQTRLEATKYRLDELYTETEFVQQSYRITEEELRHQQHLSKILKDLISKLITIDTLTEEKRQSYTSINEMLIVFNKEYDELEQNIESSAAKLSALRHDELKAKETLRELKGKLLDAKRKVQKSNIPGLPEAIVDDISMSENKVTEAMDCLAEIPLEMTSVTKRVEEAVAHVETAVESIQNTIDLAKLAELIIQYGNRYRSYSDELNEQLDEAELAFHGFYYEDAIQLAENAIAPYEPNVREKVQDLVPN